MGLQSAPGYIGDPGFDHPVELDRNMLEGIFGRTGRLRPGDFAVGKIVGALQATVSSGRAFLLGNENAAQGGYFVWSDIGETMAWPSPAGSPRIDTLLMRVRDNQYGAVGGSLGADWDIISGTPSASPVAVADVEFNAGGDFYEPGAWWRVADIRINPGDTEINSGLITNFTNYVRNPLFRTPCLSSAFPTDAVAGDRAYATDTGVEWRWSGSKWLTPEEQFVRKTADESVTNSIALQSDNHLFFPVEANSVYLIRGMLVTHTISTTVPDIKFTWQTPSGTVTTGGMGSAGDFAQDQATSDGQPVICVVSNGGAIGNEVNQVMVTGGTGGLATLRWAQIVADAVPIILTKDSYITWKKVG